MNHKTVNEMTKTTARPLRLWSTKDRQWQQLDRCACTAPTNANQPCGNGWLWRQRPEQLRQPLLGPTKDQQWCQLDHCPCLVRASRQSTMPEWLVVTTTPGAATTAALGLTRDDEANGLRCKRPAAKMTTTACLLHHNDPTDTNQPILNGGLLEECPELLQKRSWAHSTRQGHCVHLTSDQRPE